MKKSVFKVALPALLLLLACLLPFLNKAYTIDDPWFLLEAKQIVKTPLQPMAFSVCWMGNETCVAKASSLGPGSLQALMGYLLVPVVTIVGSPEWMAHLIQIILAGLAVLATVSLALRLGFTRFEACMSGLMLVAIPPFLSMASTAMPDTAACAFVVIGIERLLAWKSERRWTSAIASGVALGIAPTARFHVALMLPIAALWLFSESNVKNSFEELRSDLRRWTPIAIGFGLLVLIVLVTRDRGPVTEHTNALLGLTLHVILRNALSFAGYFAFPLPLAAVWLSSRYRMKSILVLPAIVAIPIYFYLAGRPEPMPYWMIAGYVYGFIAIVLLTFDSLRRPAWPGLLLNLWLLIPLCIVIYIHLPVKYMDPVLPAAVLIVIRTISTFTLTRQHVAYAATIAACTAVSVILLRADAECADFSRRAAAEMIAPRVAAGKKVWYGGQWGFYWYAAKAGALLSQPKHPGPLPGDLLAIGMTEGGGATLTRFPNRKLVDSRRYRPADGYTVGGRAGLYQNLWGTTLWRPNGNQTFDYEIWQVE